MGFDRPISRRETLRGSTAAFAGTVTPMQVATLARLSSDAMGTAPTSDAMGTAQVCLWMGGVLAQLVDIRRLGAEHFLLAPERTEAVRHLLQDGEWTWQSAEDTVGLITALARLEQQGFDPARFRAAQAEPNQARWLQLGYGSQTETRDAAFEHSAPDRLLVLLRQQFGEGMSLGEGIGEALRRFELAASRQLAREFDEVSGNLEGMQRLGSQALQLREQLDWGSYASDLLLRRKEFDRLVDAIQRAADELHQEAVNHDNLVAARERTRSRRDAPETRSLYENDAHRHDMRALEGGVLQVCDMHFFLQTVRLTFGRTGKPCAPLRMGQDYALAALPDDRVQVLTAHYPLRCLLDEAEIVIPARRGRRSLQIACVKDEGEPEF